MITIYMIRADYKDYLGAAKESKPYLTEVGAEADKSDFIKSLFQEGTHKDEVNVYIIEYGFDGTIEEFKGLTNS